MIPKRLWIDGGMASRTRPGGYRARRGGPAMITKTAGPDDTLRRVQTSICHPKSAYAAPPFR